MFPMIQSTHNSKFIRNPARKSNIANIVFDDILNIANTVVLMIFRIKVSDNRVLDPFCLSAVSTIPSG